MYMMQYGMPTLSLWDGISDFFDAIGSFFESIYSFFANMFEGVGMMLGWLQTAIPTNILVVNSMPSLILGAATITIGIFVIRQIFGFWIGGS